MASAAPVSQRREPGDGAGDDGFTPFLGALGDHVRALVEAPDAFVVRCSEQGAALVIEVQAPGGGALRINLRAGSDSAWSAAGYSLFCERQTRGVAPLRDPQLRPVLANLAERFAAGGEVLAQRVQAVVGAWQQRGVEDRFFRSIEHTTLGVSGMLRLGFGCNQDCGFCWQGRSWPNPPDALYFTWLDELAARGCKHLSISGGEPTLCASLPALIRRATRTHGMEVHLQTNAIRMRRKDYTQSLVEAGLHSALVSLHSADAEVSDRMTRAPRTHAGTLAGTTALLESGVFVAINCVVDGDNYEGLAAHADMVVNQFVQPFPTNPVRIVNYSQPSEYHDKSLFITKMVPLDRVRQHVVAASRTLHEAGVAVAAVGICGFPACVFVEAPELVEWNRRDSFDPFHLSSRTLDTEACSGCRARPWCPGLRKPYLRFYGERGLVPFLEPPAGAASV